ncbi:MAG TPA: LysR family transcriptional regulator [Stellaceae bacterium]|jgi:DNA-binding transcriptional LysR family regulator|nr:LysR family transcriptional regulator [Stellaceae bacterium]
MTTFATVVASGSFAAAAVRLNMSPATVTYHVQWLEQRLGVRLLNRSTRKLSVTEAGKIYHDQCAVILDQLEEADRSVSIMNSIPRGTLRLNVANVLSYSVAPLIGSFSAAYPEIAVELTTTDRMVDLVEEGIDAAIRFGSQNDSSLIARRLGQFRVILCAAPAYLEKYGTPRQPSDLSRHNCIAYMYRGFDKLTREWCLVGPEGDVAVPVSGNLQTNSLATLMAAASDARGIIMACSRTAENALRSGQLVRVLPDYHFGEFPIVAVYPHRQHLSAKVRSFVDFAAEHFAEEPAVADGAAHDAGRGKVAPLRRLGAPSS